MKKNITLNLIKYSVLMLSVFYLSACFKLEPTLYGSITEAPQGISADLPGTYGQLNGFVGQGNWYALNEHSTDEMLGPTRGTDWDDFGTWRKIHLHTWDGNHNQVVDTWNLLNRGGYLATLCAETLTGQPQAEGKFLRAFFNYNVMDLYGQVPYRAADAAPNDNPDVFARAAAYDFVVQDLTESLPGLPDWSINNKHAATKEAAWFLLAKLALNKAVYKQDPTKPEGPYTFAPADMNEVIKWCDAIINSGKFRLTPNYWKNFTWENIDSSTELIFSRGGKENYQGQTGGTINVEWAIACGSHYNDNYGGWNGFTTTADFYNSFQEADRRRYARLDSVWLQTGFSAGFRIGQQFKNKNYDDKKRKNPLPNSDSTNLVKVLDRSGVDLVFTPDVSLFFSTEAKGYRYNKFPLKYTDYQSFGEPNDFPFFRYADVLLMKAEAILRGGTATAPAASTTDALLNLITARSNPNKVFSGATLADVLAERGRELYLEAWRRNDRIRFGVFNDPVNERPTKSPGYRVVLPIPTVALSSNPNLTQNFGY